MGTAARSRLKEFAIRSFDRVAMRTGDAHGKTKASISALATRRLIADEDHTIALWGEIVIVIWRNEMRVEALRVLGMHLTDLAPRSRTGQLGRFVVVEREAPLPTPQAKEEIARMSGQCPIAFTAYVFEGDGFDAAAVRGIVTGIKLSSRRPIPLQLHPSVGDAARWVAKNHSAYASAAALEAAVQDLRR